MTRVAQLVVASASQHGQRHGLSLESCTFVYSTPALHRSFCTPVKCTQRVSIVGSFVMERSRIGEGADVSPWRYASPVELCACRSAGELCSACVDASYANLCGVAGARGWHWADRVWRVTKRPDAWANVAKARTRALQLIADLTRDRRLREILVERIIAEAAHRWEMLLAPEAKLMPWR